MNFLAQPPFRPDTHAVSYDQHPHHQLRIDRRAANVAVERPHFRAYALEVDKLIDAPKQVVAWNVILEAEIVKQPCRFRLYPHHRRDLRRSMSRMNHAAQGRSTPDFFNNIETKRKFGSNRNRIKSNVAGAD
jgi:hypothetical protein